MVKTIEVAGRKIGPGHPCFIIAEAGVNHNGSLEAAMRLVDAAAGAGADAVKFQTFIAEKVISTFAPKADYQIETTSADQSQLDMVRQLQLSQDSFQILFDYCQQKNILFISSPFDNESVDLLEKFGVCAFKVGSGELTNLNLLAYIARKGKPVLISTGMANLSEIGMALEIIQKSGNPPTALFHCVSNYPTEPIDCNLAAMAAIRNEFEVPVGWSDHTLGIHISVAAVAMGAELIEKHITLNKALDGPDHRISLEPDELRNLVKAIRDSEKAIGNGIKLPRPSEQNTASVARRSLFSARTLDKGKIIDNGDLIALRPGTGIPANRFTEFIGKRVTRDIQEGSKLSEDDFE